MTDQALAVLGTSRDELRGCLRSASEDDANRALDAIKRRARLAFHRIAQELHPDKTGNDPEKAVRFRELAATFGELKKLRIGRRPAAVRYSPTMVTIVVNWSPGTSTRF